MFHKLVASEVAGLCKGHKGTAVRQILSLLTRFSRYCTLDLATLLDLQENNTWLWSHAAPSCWNNFSCTWGNTTLVVEHRIPFSEVSFALWCSLRLLIAYFILLVIRSSLFIYPSAEIAAVHPLSFPALCPARLCPRDGMLFSSRFPRETRFPPETRLSVWLCAQLLERKPLFFLIQTQGLRVQSRQIRTAVNDALLHHPSSILPPRAWGANPTCSYFSMSPSSP